MSSAIEAIYVSWIAEISLAQFFPNREKIIHNLVFQLKYLK